MPESRQSQDRERKPRRPSLGERLFAVVAGLGGLLILGDGTDWAIGDGRVGGALLGIGLAGYLALDAFARHRDRKPT